MLSLTGMLNSAAMAAIHFFLLNELVKKRGMGKLEYMTDNGGYLLALDLLNLVNRQQRCSARFPCMFGAIFEKDYLLEFVTRMPY